MCGIVLAVVGNRPVHRQPKLNHACGVVLLEPAAEPSELESDEFVGSSTATARFPDLLETGDLHLLANPNRAWSDLNLDAVAGHRLGYEVELARPSVVRHGAGTNRNDHAALLERHVRSHLHDQLSAVWSVVEKPSLQRHRSIARRQLDTNGRQIVVDVVRRTASTPSGWTATAVARIHSRRVDVNHAAGTRNGILPHAVADHSYEAVDRRGRTERNA